MEDMYGNTNTATNTMRIRSDVYRGAIAGNPRDRFTLCHELGHYFDEKHQFSSSKQFTKLYKKYRTLFNQKTKKEYFAECFKEYVGGHQEKVKPFHSYMKTITQKIRQKNK